MLKPPDQRKRIQIGLLVSHLDDDFDSSVCEGAIEAARQMDVNLVIFPGRYINGVYADKLRTEYEYQYNTVFDLPAYGGFDILLVLIGTLGSHLNEKECKALLNHYQGTPVMTITHQIGDYPCMKVDNRTGMADVVQHLISVHGCTRIGFVSGPQTNGDAVERLNVYQSVLEKNGIAYDEKRVVYGNFSKYSGPKVEKLLDDNSDLEAIVFANDQMAFAGCEVLEKRGLRPGKDVLVTGFDNDSVAMEISPHLTTVKTDITALGHDAVVEAVHYVTTGRMEKTLISTELVVRNSCGCQGNPRLKLLSEGVGMVDAEAHTQHTYDFLMFRCRDERIGEAVRQKLYTLICALRELTRSDHIRSVSKRERIVGLVDDMIQPEFLHYVSSDDLYTMLEYTYRTMIPMMEKNEDAMLFSELVIRIYRTIAEKSAAYMQERLDNDYFITWQTNSIIRDMLIYDIDNDESYLTVMDKLQRLHMASGYLYTYEPMVINRANDKWSLPKKLHLKSYHNDSRAVLLKPEEQIIDRSELFTHSYLPSDRQYAMAVMPLFDNEEHYGLLICEIGREFFHHIQSISFQLCAALKTLTLMKQQAVTQRRLRQSLIEVRESNQLLSGLSKMDELTHCFNRRGFYEELRKRLRDAKFGSDAILVYADLDSLKTINDLRGHAEGDFAIRSAVTILREALGDDAIISRVGGDEFVCCAFLDRPATGESVLEHIEKVTSSYNQTHMDDKPYWVHISLGVYPFQCTDTVEIGELLKQADALLYARKRNKKSILKTPSQNG